jgi:hypothetical protein
VKIEGMLKEIFPANLLPFNKNLDIVEGADIVFDSLFLWTNYANKRFPPARFNFLKIHRKKGYQEAPFVGVNDNTNYLRCGNVKISNQLLKLPGQE